MPTIRMSVPSGVLTERGRVSVQRDLATVLLRWEGASDTDFFRAQAWSYLDELPEGALSERRRAGMVQDVTRTGLEAAALSEDQALRMRVLVNEQPDGTWGAGGSIIRFTDLEAVAGGQIQDDSKERTDA